MTTQTIAHGRVSNLGQIAGMLLAETHYEEADDHFGYGSVAHLVYPAQLRRCADILREFDLSAAQLQAELAARVDAKWLYFSGLDSVVADLVDVEQKAAA